MDEYIVTLRKDAPSRNRVRFYNSNDSRVKILSWVWSKRRQRYTFRIEPVNGKGSVYTPSSHFVEQVEVSRD